MSNDTPMKRCSKCGETKPATTEYFRPHKAYKDGLRPHCRECMRVYDRAYLERNKDKINPRRVERKNNDPKVIAAREQREAEKAARLPLAERRRIARKKWRDNNYDHARAIEINWKQRNPDKVHAYNTSLIARERARLWSKNNPQKRRANAARYIKNNPAVVAVRFHRRRARVRSLPNTLTTAEWTHCLDYFNHRCAVCGRPVGLWHVIAADHWIPVSHPECPGTVVSNMIPLCHARRDGEGGCNNLKLNKSPEQWLIQDYGRRKAAEILKRIQAYFDWLKGGA